MGFRLVGCSRCGQLNVITDSQETVKCQCGNQRPAGQLKTLAAGSKREVLGARTQLMKERMG